MLCLFKVVDNTTSSIRSITGNPNKLFINDSSMTLSHRTHLNNSMA